MLSQAPALSSAFAADVTFERLVNVDKEPHNWLMTNKDTGKVVWETNMQDQPAVELTAAPLVVKERVVIGASGGDRGVRSWIAGLDAASGRLVWKKFTIPAPGEAGSETWKDKNNAWQTGGAAMWTTGTFDVASAFDDETLEIRWRINMGAGFTAPPITFAVDGKQYVAISTGLSRIARGTLTQSPEAAEMRNSTVLYVFTVD